jgi:arylsulfatase A-like enzyme
MTHWAAERTIDYIRSWDGQRPFFCMMSIFDPHNPYEDYPKEMLDLVDESSIPPIVFDEVADTSRPFAVRQEQAHSYLGAFDKFTREDLNRMRLGYYASIALIDLEVGRVLDALEERGAAEDTLVVYLSDHGDMLGDHGLLVKGATLYDPCVKVPLIVRWPKQMPSGVRHADLVQPHDLAATILGAAGISEGEIRASMPESRDLRTGGHSHAVCLYRNTGLSDKGGYWDPPLHVTMMRDLRYKLLYYHGDPQSGRAPEGELFDMREDPTECRNLWESDKHREVRRRLTETLLDWLFERELALEARGGEAVPDASQRLVNALK